MDTLPTPLPTVPGVAPAEVDRLLAAGGRLVVYEYCISCLVATLRRDSRVYLLGPDETGLLRGLGFSLLALCLGIWGVPWGLAYTARAVFTNLTGGRDVRAEVGPGGGW